MQPNITGKGPRREFKSKDEWKKQVTENVLHGLRLLCKIHAVEIDIRIYGDQTASFNFGEWITVLGEDEFAYADIEIPRFIDNKGE